MPDDANIIDKLDVAIHAVEESQTLARRAGLGSEEPALNEVLATLNRIREQAGATVLQRDLPVSKPLVLKDPGA